MIGFVEFQHNVTEGRNVSVEVCASVLEGMPGDNVAVLFFTSNGSANSNG